MLEPDSTVLVVLLLLCSAGLIAVAIRYRPLAVKIAGATFAVAFAASAGITLVNDYYGYYQTWSQLADDLTGSYSHFDTANENRAPGATQHGRLERVVLAGPSSGIRRAGYVYLPHQYFEPQFARTRFPVVELIHGSPGSPTNWLVQIDIAALMDRMISQNLAGPMIVVMPAMNSSTGYEECVDAPHARDETYISQDVPRDVRARFRASTVAAEWGIAGYSSGGYCAANLALRDRGRYGAAGIIDGYFRPTDGPAAAALGFDRRAEAMNNPLTAAQRLTRGTSPLPAFWLSAGTGNARDARGTEAFATALHGVQTVTVVSNSGGGHNFYAWRSAVPRMLSWMWAQLAPPELRVQFPIAGPVTNSVIVPVSAAASAHR